MYITVNDIKNELSLPLGDKLNPQRSYRKGFALKGLHQHIIKTNNPSTIGPDELMN